MSAAYDQHKVRVLSYAPLLVLSFQYSHYQYYVSKYIHTWCEVDSICVRRVSSLLLSSFCCIPRYRDTALSTRFWYRNLERPEILNSEKALDTKNVGGVTSIDTTLYLLLFVVCTILPTALLCSGTAVHWYCCVVRVARKSLGARSNRGGR